MCPLHESHNAKATRAARVPSKRAMAPAAVADLGGGYNGSANSSKFYIVCATWNAIQCFALSSVSKAVKNHQAAE